MHVIEWLDSPPRPEPAYAECSPGTVNRENKPAESAQKEDTVHDLQYISQGHPNDFL